MGNFGLRNFTPAFDDASSQASQDGFPGMTPGGRISEEQFEAAEATAQSISPEAAALVEQEVMRQLSQAEPIYKAVHKLREVVTKDLIKGMRECNDSEMGFHVPLKDTVNIRGLTKKIEQTVQYLNFLFEDMKGMATDITSGIRLMSLSLQTELIGFVFKFKEFGADGELDNSAHGDYYEDLRRLNYYLTKQEVALEQTRGKIK